jgi:hypothetical protein
LIPANILAPTSPLDGLAGTVDIINANLLFHLLDWDQQVLVGKKIAVLLKKEGAMLLGR